MKKNNTFLHKLIVMWKILTNKYQHIILISLDKKNLENLLLDKDVAIDTYLIRLRPYIFHKIIREIADSRSDIDLALDKAEFEAESLLYTQNNKKK